MLPEPESCARMVGGQDVQLSEGHISLWQSFSSSQFPPPFCLLQSLLDLKVAEIITEPTPWLCHCVLMKGEMTSARDCLLVFWQIALCGQQRGQVARVSFGEAHWTAGGWSTGCGGDWECFSRGATWSQPFPGVGAERHLYKYHLFHKCTIAALSLFWCVQIWWNTPSRKAEASIFCGHFFCIIFGQGLWKS